MANKDNLAQQRSKVHRKPALTYTAGLPGATDVDWRLFTHHPLP
jgi:hypothetical protein